LIPGRGRDLLSFFTTASKMRTPSFLRWVLGALSMRVKQPGHEADHLLPTSAEVKNAYSHISTAPYVFMAW